MAENIHCPICGKPVKESEMQSTTVFNISIGGMNTFYGKKFTCLHCWDDRVTHFSIDEQTLLSIENPQPKGGD